MNKKEYGEIYHKVYEDIEVRLAISNTGNTLRNAVLCYMVINNLLNK